MGNTGTGFDYMVNELLSSSGKAAQSKNFSSGERGVYPAIVIDTNDPTNQNRIRARIVNCENGQIVGLNGKDYVYEDKKLPLCMPISPGFLFAKPLIGEMVIVILENPKDISSTRYWFGPIITSNFQLQKQRFETASRMFDYSDYRPNQSLEQETDAKNLFPQETDIALQGRNDADIMLKNREALLVAGKFNLNTFKENTENPSYLRLKQNELIQSAALKTNQQDLLQKFSQATLISTNINIYSPRGKFRNSSMSRLENNPDLKSFGDLANTLHPIAFGDELISLLDLMIKCLLTHIHTPQMPLAPTPLSQMLTTYTIDGKLQNIMSNHIRVN